MEGDLDKIDYDKSKFYTLHEYLLHFLFFFITIITSSPILFGPAHKENKIDTIRFANCVDSLN